MARIATDHFCLGGHGEIVPGQEIPETWNVGGGEEQPTDFARLEELGCVDPVKAPRKAKSDDGA
jgi:hypothetical protein